MKRRIFKLTLVTCFILAVTALFTVTASAETYGDLTYEVSNGEVMITACNEFATYVAIPSTIDGYPVTEIDSWAFMSCYKLTGVKIPDSVTKIGAYAFYECTKLASITIPDGVKSIGEASFYRCIKLTNITIPDSVTSIDMWAFNSCSALTSITIPDSVTDIGDEAFYGCSALTSINIPDGVKSIGGAAFSGCSRLTSINIPDGVKSIGDETFNGCSALASVTVGNGVTGIGKSAFSNCTGLKSINIPDGVKSIGDNAFYNCNKLTSMNIPDSVTSIGHYAFYYCSALKSITIPDGVKSIGYWTFLGCSGITSITIPDSVTSIGECAFSGCSGLTSMTIGNGVTDIGNYAFANCIRLTSITIPDSVKSIGGSTFSGCSALTGITIGKGVTSIDSRAFSSCGMLASITVDSYNTVYHSKGNCLIHTADKVLVIGCNNSVIPSDGSVKSIGSYAFYSRSGLNSITIPRGVQSIGESAFLGCNGLTIIVLPDSVTSIAPSAFSACNGITAVYYCGTQAQWSNISISSFNNSYLTNAPRFYHKHVTVITEPTCTEDGTTVYKCELCGLTSDPEPIPALGHSWGKWEEKVTPTCTTAGLEQKVCSACKLHENRIVAPRHTWGEWDLRSDPPCTDSGSRSRNCQSCGATETEELGVLGHDEVRHAAQAPTCTSVGWHEYTACTRCGQNNYVEIPALGHSWEEWHTVIYPTADSVGFKERCCSACSDEEYDYVYFASGDVDGDGTLTNADLTVAVRAISGWNIEGNVALIDINYDGKINNRDIIVFIQKLAGRELVYRVDPSNIQNRIYTSVKYSEPSSTDEVLCISLDLEQSITLFRGYLTCEIVYGEDECPSEEHFDYNGMSYHNVKGGADEWTNVEISDEYITISFADEVLKLELLSNDTLRVVEAVNSSEISAGDIFR